MYSANCRFDDGAFRWSSVYGTANPRSLCDGVFAHGGDIFFRPIHKKTNHLKLFLIQLDFFLGAIRLSFDQALGRVLFFSATFFRSEEYTSELQSQSNIV